MAKGHRYWTRTQILCHYDVRRSCPICCSHDDKSSHPLKQNFNQLPFWVLLFCLSVSSLLILLKCKWFGVEIEAISFWLSVSAFMAPHTLMSLMFVWGIHRKRELRRWDLTVDFFLLRVTVQQFQCHCRCGWTDPRLALQDFYVAVCNTGLPPTLGSILEPWPS